MDPYRSDRSRPPNCVLNPLGPATVLEKIHAGSIFEVFRVRVGDEIYAVKSPRPRRPERTKSWFRFGPDWFKEQHPSALPWELPIDAGCWSESSFIDSASGDPVGFTRPAECSPEEWTWLGFALLSAEAEQVRRTRGHWNHEVVALGLWNEGSSAATLDPSRSRAWRERFRPALVMPWHEGDDLGALSKKRRRKLFPRMLPALWDALLVARHGDLAPSNLRLLRDREQFVLLDPGVHLQSEALAAKGFGSDTLGMFVTNTQTYPLLRPHTPSVALREPLPTHSWGPGTPLEPHALAPLLSWEYPMSTGARSFPCNPDDVEPRPGPPPADWLAVGIMYFVFLTGQHPFYRGEFDAPVWAGARTSIFQWSPHPRSVLADPELLRWAERCRDTLASTRGLRDAERTLAFDLLSLSYTTRDELIEALMPLA